MSNAADSYVPVEIDIDFEAGVEVLPLGVDMRNDMGKLVFQEWSKLIPANYSDAQLEKISRYYWKKQNYKPTGNEAWIDFRDEKHVYEMFNLFYELHDQADIAEVDDNLPSLMKTLNFYMKQADLTETQRDILDMKLRKVKNADIAFEINKKWQKSYTPNYISTIFTIHIYSFLSRNFYFKTIIKISQLFIFVSRSLIISQYPPLSLTTLLIILLLFLSTFGGQKSGQ